MTKQQCGVAMLQWHGSISDPIYAVGSHFITGRDYPTLSVVETARSTVNALQHASDIIRDPDSIMELRGIIKFLDEYIAEKKKLANRINGSS